MTNLNELVTIAESNPDDWDARLNLAQAYKELGMVNDALTALRGNPETPMTLAQSHMVKHMRSELESQGLSDVSQSVHPVTGLLMEEGSPETGIGGFVEEELVVAEKPAVVVEVIESAEEEEILQAVEIVEGDSKHEAVEIVADDSGHEPVETIEKKDEADVLLVKKSIQPESDVDMDLFRPQDKDSDAASKASALTVAILVHVAIALLLGLVVMAMPRPNPPQIVATSFTEDAEDDIEEVKIQKVAKATAASAASKPTFAISSMASSPIAIPEFDETQSVDVTLGATAQNVGMQMSFDDGKGDTSEVRFFGIRASGNRIVFIIDVSRYMLTDQKGGIPAYNKVKEEIGQMLAGLNRQTAFNLILYEGKKVATFNDELVVATPSNIRLAIEWFDPINQEFENIGLQKGYTSKLVDSGVEPFQVNDLVHYIKASQLALQMDVSTVFLLTNGWGYHHKTIEKLELEAYMKKKIRQAKWKEKDAIAWREAVKKAQAWLKKENENRLKKGVPRKVVIGLGGIIGKVSPGVRSPPSGPPGYTMEDVEDQLKNAVSVYYRAKNKPRPRFNVVWFVGEDENPSVRIEEHLKQQTKRNRGKLKVLKGMVGLKNVTGG